MQHSDSSPNSAKRAPTILDVALMANVSKSTVSNVIRGVPGVSEETRIRVVEAIEELDYRPNVLARQLVKRRTMILGVVVGDLADPFNAEMAKLIERHAARNGYTAIFCNTEGDAAGEIAGINMLLEYRVAGIVFLTHLDKSGVAERVLAKRVPVVSVGSRLEWCDSISVDGERGARWATEHLLELGHHRIACLTTPPEEESDRARVAGYCTALAVAKTTAGHLVRWDPATNCVELDGKQASLNDLFRGDAAITGVFATNDQAAISLMEALDRLKLNIPGDVSVVGFDDVPFSRLARISLTTIAQPLEELARVGIEVLAARVEGRRAGPPRHVSVDVDLVIRSSTGPLARTGQAVSVG